MREQTQPSFEDINSRSYLLYLLLETNSPGSGSWGIVIAAPFEVILSSDFP
jgi:hypothetical protein